MFTPTDLLSQMRFWPVRNTAGEEIPSYAVARVDGFDADGTIRVAKPDADGLTPAMLVLNGPAPIPSGGYGQATRSWPWWALADYDGSGSGSGAGSLGVGDEVGTAAGSWSLAAGRAGFRVWGTSDDAGLVSVVADAGLACGESGSGSGSGCGANGTPLGDLIRCESDGSGGGQTQVRNVCLAVNVCGRLYPVVALDPDTGEQLG